MKKLLSIITGLAISASAFTYDFQKGWQLEGALTDMNITQFKNINVISVWTYDYKNQKWRAYFPNQLIDLDKYGIEPLTDIKKGEGFWVNSTGNFSLDIVDDVQRAYEQGYQDALNSCSSNNENIDEIGDNEEGTYYTSNLVLVDTPSNFSLNDIAGKSFKVFSKDKYIDLVFNNDGIGYVSFSDDDNYTLVYDNGVIKVNNEKDNFNFIFKKLKENENGIIVAAMDENGNFMFLDAWLKNVNPIDMSTLNYPITFYTQWGDSYTIENNGTIEYPWGDSVNYSFENGKIVVDNIWDNEDRGDEFKDSFQIIDTIDRYYVLSHKVEHRGWYISDYLKDKTFDDIIDSNYSVNGLFLKSNGVALIDANEAEYYNDNEFITYTKINSTEINVTECWDNNYCDNYLIFIDPATGKVTREDVHYYPEIVSTSPIVELISATTATPVFKKQLMNIKKYYELQIKRSKKRGF